MTTTRPTTRRLLGAVALCAALLAGTVAAAPTAGAATPENTNYVRSLYNDLLDRVNTTGDDAGVAYWANRLETNETRYHVVQSLMKAGSEYYGQIVDINYALFLDRSADPGGRDFYVQGWRNRDFTLERVIVALGNSNEYYQRIGGTEAAFVDAIYFDVLGREADAGGRAFGRDYVATHGRGQYVSVLVRSAEARGHVVDDAFGTFLGRSPTTSERQGYVEQLGRGGLRRENFDARIVTSGEYYENNIT